MNNKIIDIFDEHNKVVKNTQQNLTESINQACQIVTACIGNGNKILLFGNGGSAADAQHIAAELVGRFLKERRSLPALALTTDTSAITAIGNDYGYEHIFRRQVEGLAVTGDVLIGISTSGNSQNVINALKAGKSTGCKVLGLSGRDGGGMNDICDLNIVIPSEITARIQEMHILIGHILCEAIDEVF
ncbi:MAG: SIS domain-containing protein [Sphingobacteriaceae bacterium]|nr:MAG: SIS domain-containing protein [Sphingobacteriaceae bacterium]